MFKNFLSALFKKNTGLKNSAGLTLVELMVVVAIMMIMTAVVFVNYQPGNQQLALNRSAHKLAQDIRKAQEMAMSSTECPERCPMGTAIPCPCAGQVPPRHGIYIGTPYDVPTPTSYILFAATSTLDDGLYRGSPYSGNDIIIDEIDFETDIRLVNLTVEDCDIPLPAGGQQRIHITFIPPDPVTVIRLAHPESATNKPTCGKITLTLRVGVAGLTKSVVINSAGLIYVE